MSVPEETARGFGSGGTAGRFGGFWPTLRAGTGVQVLAVLAGFIAIPVTVRALGSTSFGVLVVVVSLAPWLTLVDGALYPATRLLIGESRAASDATSAGVLRAAFRMAVKIAGINLGLLVLAVTVLPLAALFGAEGSIGPSELIAAVLAFSLPVIASGPGGVYLGALEGAGRTVVAAVFAGIGPIAALPLTVLVAGLGGGLVPLCGVQGLSVALPRACAWVYWRIRPSWHPRLAGARASHLRLALVLQLAMLSSLYLVQTGLDPVIVSSRIGADAAAELGLASRLVYGALIPVTVLSPLFMANIAGARGAGWSPERTRDLRRLIIRSGVAGAAVGLSLLLLGPSISRLLGAGEVTPGPSLFASGAALVTTAYVLTPLSMAFSGPTGMRRSVWLNVVLTVTNVGLSVALVIPLGPAGPLWASALCFGFAIAFWLGLWRLRPELLAETHAGRRASAVPGPDETRR